MLQGLWKLLLYTFIFYLIYQIIRFFQAINKRSQVSRPPRRSSGMMVKDEICNTYLPEDNAVLEIYQGKEYFFCSQACRQKFLETKN